LDREPEEGNLEGQGLKPSAVSPANTDNSAAIDTVDGSKSSRTPDQLRSSGSNTSTTPPPDNRLYALRLSDNTILEEGLSFRRDSKNPTSGTEKAGDVISHNVLLLRKVQGQNMVYRRAGIGVILREKVGWFEGSKEEGGYLI
jgi:hypothetical protein